MIQDWVNASTATNSTLGTMLCLAVQWHQMEANGTRDFEFEDIKDELSETAKELGSKGDILMYGGGKEGEVAILFNRLGRALFLLSYSVGGITVFGQHFESFPSFEPLQGEQTQ